MIRILLWSTPALRLWVVAAFLLFWEAAARTGVVDPVFFGMPSGVASFFVAEYHALAGDLLWTLAGALLSFLVGSAAAILLGLAFLASPKLEEVLDPILAALNSMPRIALAPLFLIWFGLGLSSKVAMGASLTFFIVLSSTVAGGKAVAADHLTLATTLNASAAQRFFHFVLPTAVPTIFSGLRLGLIYALLGVVGSEIIAAEHGLGQQVALLASGFKTNGVLAILLVLALVGAGLSQVMTSIEHRLLRWR
ncbi:MAG: ABC transporter permease [Lautropia sp.]